MTVPAVAVKCAGRCIGFRGHTAGLRFPDLVDGRVIPRLLHQVEPPAMISGVTTPTEIGWLAGLVDGEGSIALSHGGTRTPHLRVMLYNSSIPILDKAKRILDDLGVAYFAK